MALSTAKDVGADAVILNLRFDRETSIWWVVEALAADPSTRTIPLIVCIDPSALQPDRRRYLAERRARLLLLPFTPEELLNVLERALREDA